MKLEGTMRIYACGGMGTNAGMKLFGVNKSDGFSDLEVCFIDTSLSNIIGKTEKQISDDDVFILEGVDGSGKLRQSNYNDIVKNVKPILHKFKPAEFNIVVSSASGGSGSLISAVLLKELLEKGHTAVCILVGSEESKITIENTVKTLQTLDTISRKQVNKPIVISYYHNSGSNSRQMNDEEIRRTITALSILASRQNSELDTADVNNFIGFQNVTSVKDGIALLYITNSEAEAAKIEYPISVASLFSKVGDTTQLLTPEYNCAGYPIHPVLKEADLHYVISQYDVKNLFSRLSKRLEEFNESSSARIQTASLGGHADDNGIVL